MSNSTVESVVILVVSFVRTQLKLDLHIDRLNYCLGSVVSKFYANLERVCATCKHCSIIHQPAASPHLDQPIKHVREHHRLTVMYAEISGNRRSSRLIVPNTLMSSNLLCYSRTRIDPADSAVRSSKADFNLDHKHPIPLWKARHGVPGRILS